MKMYGTTLCGDCRNALDILDNTSIKYDYIDICSHILCMKEYIQLRDKRSEFDSMKENGLIGLPCFLFDDGTMSFEVDDVLKKNS